MTAAELLGMARAEGVALVLAGDRLTWTADHQPPADLLAGLAALKREVIAALSAANDAQAAPEPPQATTAAPAASTPAPAAERPAEARRNAWTITRGGKPICTMVGEPSTRTEALVEARWRWPDADILEN